MTTAPRRPNQRGPGGGRPAFPSSCPSAPTRRRRSGAGPGQPPDQPGPDLAAQGLSQWGAGWIAYRLDPDVDRGLALLHLAEHGHARRIFRLGLGHGLPGVRDEALQGPESWELPGASGDRRPDQRLGVSERGDSGPSAPGAGGPRVRAAWARTRGSVAVMSCRVRKAILGSLGQRGPPEKHRPERHRSERPGGESEGVGAHGVGPEA